MGHTADTDHLPPGVVKLIGLFLVAAVLGVATMRLSGIEVHSPDAPTVASRSLRFEDRPDGSVAVIDAKSAQVIRYVHGEAGFLRGALRALARERKKRDLGSGPAFELLARADGRLTLSDPATGERLDLESFGPTNLAVFAGLLNAGR
jgi:putative photosynthetic complex assembly protein